MRIGILTATRTDNIGTDLQALATQWIFETYGCDVSLINYKCTKLENSRKIFFPISLKGFLNIPYKINNHLNHMRFRAKFFHYSNNIYSCRNISELDYDYIVVGSDQIWNLKITGNDLNFFLPFPMECKKYSYASSFGVTDITCWEKEFLISKYLKDFESVSVRETSGVEALKKIGIMARCDLDPLLMVDANQWRKIANHINRKPYLLVYVVERTYEILDECKRIAKKNNYDIIYYGNPLRIIPGVKIIRFSGIEDWIDLIANAELIVTNSYHGLSFAINFHKAFSVYRLEYSQQSNTRIECLLSQVGLDKVIEGKIYNPDWKAVDSRLENLRNTSKLYIEEILKKDD